MFWITLLPLSNRLPCHAQALIRPLACAVLDAAIPQAPVSDREQLATLPDTAAYIKEARARRGGEELMPVAASEAPITPERFLSLATKVK